MACDKPIPIFGLASVAPPKWDGGARSKDSFSGDGFVRFSTGGDAVGAVAGLSNFDSGPNVGDIDYGILFKYNKYKHRLRLFQTPTCFTYRGSEPLFTTWYVPLIYPPETRFTF